jgi:hypothetical protein
MPKQIVIFHYKCTGTVRYNVPVFGCAILIYCTGTGSIIWVPPLKISTQIIHKFLYRFVVPFFSAELPVWPAFPIKISAEFHVFFLFLYEINVNSLIIEAVVLSVRAYCTVPLHQIKFCYMLLC